MAQRVVLTNFGSYGDLHPFIAIGLKLKAQGFDAVIAASEIYRAKVETAGLEFQPAGPSLADIEADTGLDPGGAVRGLARNSLTFIIGKVMVPYADRTYAEMCEVLRGADLVVGSIMTVSARLAAAKLGVRTATLLLAPSAILSAEAPSLVMEAPHMPWVRRWLGVGALQALLDLGRLRLRRWLSHFAALRRREGLPPSRGDEMFDEPLYADLVCAVWSPLLGPLPPDMPGHGEIAGTVFYDSEAGAANALDPQLAAFLDAGPPPLVFTLGSFVVSDARDFYAAGAEAAKRLGRRAVLLVGREAEARLSPLATEDVFVAGYAPHSLVFPRAAAVIHHGGIGTVGQALLAGKPQLVCAVLGDQFDNGERLVRLGVARRLDLRKFTAKRAEAVLGLLLSDVAAAERATVASQQVAAEDGAAYVARRIGELLGTPSLAQVRRGGAAAPILTPGP